ncbi:MAG: VOC family protein [Rhodobiaceae bacterium]|nr:VOC family protein [Rhodobiaceae bacterium]
MKGLGAMPIIEVGDLDAAFAAYTGRLCFQGGNTWHDDNGVASFAIVVLDAIRLGLRRREGEAPTGHEEWSAYLYVDDVDAHHDAVKRAGAEIVYPLEDQFYGCRDYTIRDPDGHLIAFGQEIDEANQS